MISKEQAEEIKKQLVKQVDKSPQENKEQIKEYISQLDEGQLEEFLKQNKIQLSPSKEASASSKCIFCSIAENEIPSYKIAENKKALAILEISPLSKGHIIIAPFEHTSIDKLSKASLSLAQKTAKKLKTKLKPEDVKIETSSLQGHAIINVIPFYKNEKIEKKKATEEELQQLQSLLKIKKRQRLKTTGTIKIKSIKGLPKISFRIP